MGTIYYGCDECEEHNPEGYCFLRDMVRVMPDGKWICENCYNDAPDWTYVDHPPTDDEVEQSRWASFPMPGESPSEIATQNGLWQTRALKAESSLKAAREALEPFAKVAEQDIGADEADTDFFSPMRSPYNRAPRIRVGDLRRAAALTKEQ